MNQYGNFAVRDNKHYYLWDLNIRKCVGVVVDLCSLSEVINYNAFIIVNLLIF